MAPELFQKRQYDEKVDIFAFGALLWELIAREVPFDGLEPIDIKQMVEKNEQLKIPYGTDARLSQLVSSCRVPNPSERPDFDSIVDILAAVVNK